VFNLIERAPLLNCCRQSDCLALLTTIAESNSLTTFRESARYRCYDLLHNVGVPVSIPMPNETTL